MRKLLLTSAAFVLISGGAAFAANSNISSIAQTGNSGIAEQTITGTSVVNSNTQNIAQSEQFQSAEQNVTDVATGGSTDNLQYSTQYGNNDNSSTQSVDSGDDNIQGVDQNGLNNNATQSITSGDGNEQYATQAGNDNIATQTVN